jgi:hypothetical protein
MANSVPLPPPGFDQLSVDEQIGCVKEHDRNPDAGESWDVVRERLLDKLRQR